MRVCTIWWRSLDDNLLELTSKTPFVDGGQEYLVIVSEDEKPKIDCPGSRPITPLLVSYLHTLGVLSITVGPNRILVRYQPLAVTFGILMTRAQAACMLEVYHPYRIRLHPRVRWLRRLDTFAELMNRAALVGWW